MRTDIVRLYRVIHSWVGIVSGLILFIAFYAGALTMFKEPLAAWVTPPRAAENLIPLDRGGELVSRLLALRPEAAKDFSLILEPGHGDAGALRLEWRLGREDTAVWTAAMSHDGHLDIRQEEPSAVAQLVDDVHRTAILPGDRETGTFITGIASALYVVALVSGVIILIPSLVKDFFALRLANSVKRLWLDVHNLLGIISVPFHIVIALSAVVFGLHDYFYDSLDEVVYGGRMQKVIAVADPPPRPAPKGPYLAPAALLAKTAAVEPGLTPTSLQYQRLGTPGAMVRVWGDDPRYLVRRHGFLVLDPATGNVVSTEYLPGHQGRWGATVSAFFALHFGSFGGALVRWSYFVMGLAGAFLFYSGNLLWVEARRRTERRAAGPVTQTRAVTLMAAATVGVSLGAAAGLSATIAAGRWLSALDSINTGHLVIYYAVFLSACAWAFWRGAGRAGYELLWLAAGTTAAIPATSLLGFVIPGLWVSGAGLGVDAVALMGAGAFALMARAAARRAENGPADSVWSARRGQGAVTAAQPQAAE